MHFKDIANKHKIRWIWLRFSVCCMRFHHPPCKMANFTLSIEERNVPLDTHVYLLMEEGLVGITKIVYSSKKIMKGNQK